MYIDVSGGGISSNPLTASDFKVTRQTVSTNLTPLEYDSVEISAENKIKKQGMSTGMKVLLGTAGLAAAAFVHHKFLHPKIIQKQVQDIFLKDVTKEEALNIQKKYRDILKIKDKDEFIDKMMAELKTDYSLENIPIKLDKNFKSGEKVDAIVGAAHYTPTCSEGYFTIGVDTSFSNQQLFKNMSHEMRHAKQEVMGWKAINKDEWLSIYKDRMKDVFKGEKEYTEERINEYTLDIWQERFNFYNKLGIKSIDKNDRNYEWARKVIESMRTYANKSNEAYKTTFYEADAKSTENMMWRMVNSRFF